MPEIHMADVSEFQSNVDAPTYLKAGYQCIICRAHNGTRPDHMMPVRRDYLRRHSFVAIGWYQYVVAGRDAATQAHEFLQTLGGLRPNEYVIGDWEEGAGDQTHRAQAWFAVADRWCGFPATLYSGDSFLRNQLGGSGRWRGRPIWVAAYGQHEPSQAHTLWQYADNFHFPGVTGPSDVSIHHDTAVEYLSAVRAGHVPKHPTPPKPKPHPAPQPPPHPAPHPPKPPEDTVQTPSTYMTADSRIGFVVTTDAGEVKHIEQQNPPGSKDAEGNAKNPDFWRDKQGNAHWLSLGKP
jgi:GH25 family lysozyme M1 (1,4-beta-N-acetylmuramidase)